MASDKSKSYFPVAGESGDGWSTEDEATATCFCGAVQLAFVSHSSLPLYQSHTKGTLHFPNLTFHVELRSNRHIKANPRSRPA